MNVYHISRLSHFSASTSNKRIRILQEANKSTLKILVNKNIFFSFALYFVLRVLKLLKYYAKKFETIKTNLIVR